MNRSPTALRWQPKYPIQFAISVLIAAVGACTSEAADSTRIWVDADGLFSVEARLVEVYDDKVVLLRADGGQTTIEIDKLSDRDKEYLEEIEEQRSQNDNQNNPLRMQAPKPPQIKPLPILDLPPANRVADDGSIMTLGDPVKAKLLLKLPGPLAADPSPFTFGVANACIPILKVGSYDNCSRPLAVATMTDSGTRRTSIAMSISRGLWIPGEKPRHQLVRFDVDDGKVHVALDYDSTIALLDHHPNSGRSLLLVGHNSLGEGGELRIGTQWDKRSVQLSHQRKLTGKREPGQRVPHLRWARWVDEEHFIAVIDQTLGLWNIVSGDQVYRIDGIHQRAQPAISGGRRYVAVPYHGSVQLFETQTGRPLGRIGIENQVPSVAFSPQGNTLAITTTRRLRNWDLPSGALSADIESRRGLGTDRPIWIDSDLVLSSSGVLLSVFRGLPIWRYDISSSETVSIGAHVVMFRKQPVSELSIVSLPHEGAANAMRWIDNSPADVDNEKWRVAGTSVWNAGGWQDRDVQISALPVKFR